MPFSCQDVRGTSGNGGFTPIEDPSPEVATVPSPLYYPAHHSNDFGSDHHIEHHHQAVEIYPSSAIFWLYHS